MMQTARRGVGNFTDEDREKAQLPLPPEQDSNVQALLRPGLLADVEIVVEKIPNALHVPRQAVFEKSGKSFVYVQQADGKFQEREVQVAKQSESTRVLSSGVKPGEIVALVNPNVDRSEKKKKGGETKSKSNPMGAVGGK
jgi:multidrug efflux pump subunit AcrA (membrane-fusion protein)